MDSTGFVIPTASDRETLALWVETLAGHFGTRPELLMVALRAELQPSVGCLCLRCLADDLAVIMRISPQTLHRAFGRVVARMRRFATATLTPEAR